MEDGEDEVRVVLKWNSEGLACGSWPGGRKLPRSFLVDCYGWRGEAASGGRRPCVARAANRRRSAVLPTVRWAKRVGINAEGRREVCYCCGCKAAPRRPVEGEAGKRRPRWRRQMAQAWRPNHRRSATCVMRLWMMGRDLSLHSAARHACRLNSSLLIVEPAL